MRKSADTRFWISIIASAFVFPVAAIAIFAVWFIRLDLPSPTDAIPGQAILVATPPATSTRGQVDAAMTSPLEAGAEPAASPPPAQTPEPLSTMPALGNARSEYPDPEQTASTADSSRMPVEPTADTISPERKQQTEGAVAPQLDATGSERLFMPPMIATLAVAPLMPRNTLPVDNDPARDASPPAILVMPTEPTAPSPSRLIDGQIALPRPRPHITIANVSRAAPLPRPRPIENSLLQGFQQ
jgi:hypothetical protein